MIKIKSNISDCKKKLIKYKNNLKNKLDELVKFIANEFYNKLIENINKSLPYEEHIDDYLFKNDVVIEHICELFYKIKLGENSGRHMTNGQIVNPFYFFEFGFGAIGENSYNINGEVLDSYSSWVYDVNNHGFEGWYYKINGNSIWTNGIEGLGFISDTITWFNSNLSDIINQAKKKVGI